MEKFLIILICGASFVLPSSYCCRVSRSGGSCLTSGLSFGGRISLSDGAFNLITGTTSSPATGKIIFIFQKQKQFGKRQKYRSLLGHFGVGRIWMSSGNTCRNPTGHDNLHCPALDNQPKPCLDNNIPCPADVKPPVTIDPNPNGTTTINLSPDILREATGYKVEYRKVNTTTWKSEEFIGSGPSRLTGPFEEGYTYEMKISLKYGEEFDNPSIFRTFTVPCRDVSIQLHLSTSSRRRGNASIRVTWNFREPTPGPCSVLRQTIAFKQMDLDNCPAESNPLTEPQVIDNREHQYTVRRMSPNTEYNVSLTMEMHRKPYNVWKTIRTVQTAPSAPPSGIEFSERRKSRQVRVRWNEIPCGERNGQMEFYSIEMVNAGGTHVQNVKSTSARYFGFSVGEQYSVRVAAINSHGIGPYSQRVTRTYGN